MKFKKNYAITTSGTIIIPLLLAGLVGFCFGLFTAKSGQLHQFITPLVASISILFATTIAILNLNQSRKNELLKRTLEQLSKEPKINDNLLDAADKIKLIINQEELYNYYDDYDKIRSSMKGLDKSIIYEVMDYLNFYDNLSTGLKIKLYDSDLIDNVMSNTFSVIWKDFWPVARLVTLGSDKSIKHYGVKMKKPYMNLEKKAIKPFKDYLELIKTEN
ncbi:DUF4760 domain-containing protein [Vibrio cincinnatiensis]|uniref:DUF4760 domain-containing protein n=1 Tax=Vibrio cincinnatiensis TaxID=675 RepID=UPI001EDE7B51|nr:hypothetical protein [Vibrio cincinnatiensis]MCG3727480.1 hypothetical protein [Vibrio cincinnatiensis]